MSGWIIDSQTSPDGMLKKGCLTLLYVPKSIKLKHLALMTRCQHVTDGIKTCLALSLYYPCRHPTGWTPPHKLNWKSLIKVTATATAKATTTRLFSRTVFDAASATAALCDSALSVLSENNGCDNQRDNVGWEIEKHAWNLFNQVF